MGLLGKPTILGNPTNIQGDFGNLSALKEAPHLKCRHKKNGPKRSMMYGGETIRTAAMLTAQRKKMAEKDVMFLLKLSWVGRGEEEKCTILL